MITLLGYSFFCMLTLAAPDVSLIARDAKIKVPFAGTEVSYQAFIIIGPLTMFVLAIYLHILLGHWLSLGKHKDTSGLPYIFNIDNKTANWLANLIFYWLPCLVPAFFSWKALPRPKESFLLIIQTAIFFSCMVLLRIRRFPDDQHRFKFNVLYLFVWLLGVCLLLGAQLGFYERSLDLFRADLSKKDLRNTYLFKANLVEADLNGANLQAADLEGADLRAADLRETIIREANLSRAELQKADLRGANLGNAILMGFDPLAAAYLEAALLRDSLLGTVYLQGADLRAADLRETIIPGANLRAANLQAADLRGADLRAADLRETIIRGANLRAANLQAADLEGADLRAADLRETIIREANLREANLGRADLRGAKGLTVEQLCNASTLYEAILDQEIEAQIKQKCPKLLKEP
jgi:uncharacterized protein YjbI with pentapeptide repeats